MIISKAVNSFLISAIAFAAAGFALSLSAMPVRGEIVLEKGGNLGVIKGVVRDEAGTGISDATVAIFRVGTSTLLKQVRSASDGSFLAKIIPGTYTILAVAQGFNPVTLTAVEVNRSAELVYGFKLERAGSGNTLPEKRADRNSSKWRIRAANSQRAIYQNAEGDTPIDESNANAEKTEAVAEIAGPDDDDTSRRGQTVVETYFASNDAGNYSGVNFATLVPINENAEIVFAGQVGTSKSAPQRIETNLKFRPSDEHQIRINTSFGKLGTLNIDNRDSLLGQFSFQALDEWKIREGVIVVVGIDYSRFVGAGDDFAISPRLGLQFDLDSKTRFRTAYTTQTEQKSWARAIELEDSQITFQEPVAIEDFVIENARPRLNKSKRFEFGIERILDNKSSIEANAFFDTTLGRGVGLTNLPFDTLGGDGFGEFVANQQGRSQGLRVVYNRRLSGFLSASAGYAFGNGQKLSDEAITNPAKIFENGFFQTLFGQVVADLKSGTNIRTIFRFSPQATVFAIDPFQGRLAIYDPSLSVMVTQNLPTLGLPFHAQAIVDARNLFDFQTGVNGEDGGLRINSQRRMLRGGILVRF